MKTVCFEKVHTPSAVCADEKQDVFAKCSRPAGKECETCGLDLQQVNLSRPALQGALMTVSLVYGLPVLRSMNQEESADLIEMGANQLTHLRTGALKRCGSRPKGSRKQKLYFLQGLPGIGPDRAEQILDHFETIENVVKADYEELLKVESIGPGTAKKIYQAVREPPPQYGSAQFDHEFRGRDLSPPNPNSILSPGTGGDEIIL